MEYWRGIGKLGEECGEVQQLVGKAIAFPVGPHPDGQGELRDRFLMELGDLLAAIDYFRAHNSLPDAIIEARRQAKYAQFVQWGLSGILVPDPPRTLLPIEDRSDVNQPR